MGMPLSTTEIHTHAHGEEGGGVQGGWMDGYSRLMMVVVV